MFQNQHKYDDIIDLPHHVSGKHPQMDLLDRAAQFSPFAALTGYDAALEETGRLTDERIELDENAQEILDLSFRKIREKLEERPCVSITYFQPDELKAGGKYVTITGSIKKLDETMRRLVFEDGMVVGMDEVVEINVK